MSKKILSPGTNSTLRIYEQVGPRGGKTGEQADSTRGNPLPPMGRGNKGSALVKAAHHRSGK
jgi:hypothetical protein